MACWSRTGTSSSDSLETGSGDEGSVDGLGELLCFKNGLRPGDEEGTRGREARDEVGEVRKLVCSHVKLSCSAGSAMDASSYQFRFI